ncbi:hypothetical protein ACFFQW_46940 [Umezawaea endophytica]|uniref:Uncharacterized protein n=1 Tax=Umezawaea endophytica TaxID=1654476 RepID=A0A9X2VM22_9PSEU|nr:hypothetical protein [Umezawaea endophytica]MCS7479006.1 hypothetical protein [Umezawaea endophytica]
MAEFDLPSALGLPATLPPLRTPATTDLVAAARSSALLGQALALSTWADGRRVYEDSDFDDFDGDLSDSLDQVWYLAHAVGFVEVDEDSNLASLGPSAEPWRTGGDEAVLELWDEAYTHLVIESMTIDSGDDLDLEGVGGATMTALFMARSAGLALAEFSAMARAAALEQNPPERWDAYVTANGDPSHVLLNRLEALGAVEFDASESDAPYARMTGLGAATMRDQMCDGGFTIPPMPAVADMTAADLVAATAALTPDELRADTAAWLALRSPADAAAELLAAAVDATGRVFAATTIADIPVDAATAWESALDTPGLRPYAQRALTRPHEPADRAWLLVDTLAVTTDPDDRAAIAEELATAADGDETALFDHVWRLPHPDAAAVLTLIGDRHPEKKTAKAARKAAFKAASRR